MIPDFLSHYYEASRGPFRNLSDLQHDEAEIILDNIRQKGDVFASSRAEDYLDIRRGLEEKVRGLFIDKGGKPQRQRPHYMILGACPWLKEWYLDGQELRIPLTQFRPEIVSFTYGDTFPAMRYQDGKPYREQVYTLDELPSWWACMDYRKCGITKANTALTDILKPKFGLTNQLNSYYRNRRILRNA